MIDMLRVPLIIVLIGFSFWGCLVIIGTRYGLRLPLFHHYLYVAIWTAGPAVLLLISVVAWVRARSWRRMEIMRDQPPGGVSGELARGAYRSTAPDHGPGALERISKGLTILALATFPYWLGANQPEWWAGMILGLIWLFRFILPRSRPGRPVRGQ